VPHLKGDVSATPKSASLISISVNQEGVNSFAAALWNPQQYEIFIDDQKVGVLNGYTNHKTCAVSSGAHSVYVRAYARNSVSITRVYGYSQGGWQRTKV
jgi:hypothetical protein